jgi:flagellar basal body-associated protein FliL
MLAAMRVNRILIAAACAALCVGPALAAGGSEGGGQAPASRQERLTSADSWLPMPTLSACILNRTTTDATIIVDMGIDVPNETLRRHANANGPRIRDALRTALTTYANTYYRIHTAPDPATITRVLQQAVDQTLGAQGGRVLLVNIMFQRRQGL